MNLKKLIPISDHFPFFTFPKKKFFSGFSLGLVSFFIFLCVVFFNVSFKNPISSSFVFKGFSVDNSSSNSTALISWLSFSRNPTVNSGSNGKLGDLGDAHFGNFTNDAKNGSFNGVYGKKSDFEGTLLSNVTNDVKNGSFNGVYDKKSDFEGTLLSNVTNDVKNGSFNGVYDTKSGFEGTLLSNGTNDVKNVSFGSNSVNSDNSESTLLSNVTNDVKNNSFGGISDDSLDGKVLIGGKDANVSDANAGLMLGNFSSSYKECDIFDGRWVRDDTKPYYPAGSCPYIDRDFDCHLNKRPDDGYVKWRWQPYGCDIPSLNATDFLERLRGKKLVFIGDSLNRNMWESLVCILRASVPDKKRVYEISGRHEFKKKGFYAFRFEDYNCTVDFVGSPFLVRETSFKGKNGSIDTLRLDLMDRTTSMYHDADVLVFNTGHWWTHEKTSRGEDYYQEGNHVYPRLKVLDAYKRALSTWARWVDNNIDINKTQVIFRGYSVTHFKGGQWNSGGQCHKETEPIFNTSHFKKYPSKMRAFDNVLREMKTPVVYLNISRLTDYRKDGHPSIYRMEYKTVEEQIAAERSQDCSHWCLPGVPDTWNELLYASLLKVGRGSWKI